MRLARLVPLEDGVADALHRAARSRVRLLRTGVEDIPNFLRVGFKFFAACLNRLDPGDQVFGHQFLAIDAADRRCPAVAVHLRDRFRQREQLVGESAIRLCRTFARTTTASSRRDYRSPKRGPEICLLPTPASLRKLRG